MFALVGFLVRDHASGFTKGPPSLRRALGGGQNQILAPASSFGSQGRNIPFREDIVEPAVRTTVSVANNHPWVPPPLETAGSNELQSSSLETPPRVRISNRNGVKCGNLM